MSAPLIWGFFPILASLALITLSRWVKWVGLAGFLIAVSLTLAALFLPLGEPFPVRFWPGVPLITIRESIPFLGARFTLGDSIRPALILLYAAAAFWFGAASVIRVSTLFFPVGLGLSGILCLSLAVNPDHYAPFFWIIAMLGVIPILSPPRKPVSRGIKRMITSQILGTGLILLAKWALLVSAIQAEQEFDPSALYLLMTFGFALILPVFPFHSWIPLLAEEAEPIPSSFVFFVLPLVGMLHFIKNFSGVSLVSTFGDLTAVIRGAAILMMVYAGSSAWFETRLRRIIGFAVLHQVGAMLLAFNLVQSAASNRLYAAVPFMSFIPWGAGLLVWVLSQNIAESGTGFVGISQARGLIRRYPWVSAGILAGIFSLAGLPALAGFPAYLGLGSVLAGESQPAAWIVWAGNLLLFLTGLRFFSVMAQTDPELTWSQAETRLQALWIAGGIAFLVLLGLFPNLITAAWANLAGASAFITP